MLVLLDKGKQLNKLAVNRREIIVINAAWNENGNKKISKQSINLL